MPTSKTLPPSPAGYVSYEEAARMLNYTEHSLRQLMYTHRMLHPVRVQGYPRKLLPLAEVERWRDTPRPQNPPAPRKPRPPKPGKPKPPQISARKTVEILNTMAVRVLRDMFRGYAAVFRAAGMTDTEQQSMMRQLEEAMRVAVAGFAQNIGDMERDTEQFGALLPATAEQLFANVGQSLLDGLGVIGPNDAADVAGAADAAAMLKRYAESKGIIMDDGAASGETA